MDECRLCPRNCLINRTKGEFGYCGAPGEMIIARYSLHMWEEPVISGENGSGTIFFSYCNLKCIFCQNYEISEMHKGRIVSVEEFCDICLELEKRRASNINLVTGCMYVPLIVKGIKMARDKGLSIPIVYNTSGYENIDTIKMLEGVIDIYLPDLKYMDSELGLRYSGVRNYFECASETIMEMYRQVGKCKFDNMGMLKKGVVVRHLMLPGSIIDSKNVIEYLYKEYGDNIYISIMNQYTPLRKLKYDCLNRKVTNKEYDEVIEYAYNLGVRNAFVQEEGTVDESFVPNFDNFNGV
jgi:putative pyruvate formate lyase activating enzyme